MHSVETEALNLLSITEKLVLDERLDVELPDAPYRRLIKALLHEVAWPNLQVRPTQCFFELVVDLGNQLPNPS